MSFSWRDQRGRLIQHSEPSAGNLSSDRAEICIQDRRQTRRGAARSGSDRAELLDGIGLGDGEHHGRGRRAADPAGSAARRHLLIARSSRSASCWLNPISLARTLPGVVELAGSSLYTTGSPSVNGQRPRANNYLLDSTENNDIVYTGSRSPSTSPTLSRRCRCRPATLASNSAAPAAGIFNVVTKSGTNSLHGTLLWRYQSQRFNSVSNVDKLTSNAPVRFQPQRVWLHGGRTGSQGQDILLRRLSAGHAPIHSAIFLWSFRRKRRSPHFALYFLRIRGWIFI